MTAKTRKNMLRMADAAANAQERSAKQLLSLYEVYDPDYPDLALQVAIMIRSANELGKLINRFRHERM